jgi:hypothetical protein
MIIYRYSLDIPDNLAKVSKSLNRVLPDRDGNGQPRAAAEPPFLTGIPFDQPDSGDARVLRSLARHLIGVQIVSIEAPAS